MNPVLGCCPTDLLGRTIGFLTADQESQLARAVVLAYDLGLLILDNDRPT